MNTTSSLPHVTSTTPSGRALVLGGGGSTGNAWLIGIVAGLFDAGLDVTSADLTIGTSAGATAAAQLAGATPRKLFDDILSAPLPQRAGSLGPERAGGSNRPVSGHLDRMREIIASAQDAADMRRTFGAAALQVDAESDGSARWRTTVAARLSSTSWPTSRVLLTAVDARTGEPVVFDRDSGVDLVDAVAASTAGGGFAYRIRDGRYIDGGYRSNADNADLASGYERVLVLSPLSGRTLMRAEWGIDLATQVSSLRDGGSSVETIFPDPSSEHLFGANAMNVSLRPAAAQAGYDQGQALAKRLTEFWM